MADEENLEYEVNPQEQNINKIELRIKNLSEKVKLTSEERDQLAKTKEELEKEKNTLAKEVEFFKNFNPLVSKYSEAANYQDKIREKVLAGYDVEDATISILAKEGKFSSPQPKMESPVGGSATNTIKANADKPIQEMNRDELRSALLEAEKRGDLFLN